jgi:hypothetical protein
MDPQTGAPEKSIRVKVQEKFNRADLFAFTFTNEAGQEKLDILLPSGRLKEELETCAGKRGSLVHFMRNAESGELQASCKSSREEHGKEDRGRVVSEQGR